MATADARETDWQQALAQDDEAGFQAHVEPHTNVLLVAARRALRFYRMQGHLHRGDLSPEEVVGETMLHAWHHRTRVPPNMTLRGWLLGTQYRVLRGLVDRIERYREDKAISLDAPIPLNHDAEAAQEWFWEWYQDAPETLWEDTIPSHDPVDLEVPLFGDDESVHDALQSALHDGQTSAPSAHVLMMHQEFDMPLSEVAYTLGRSVNDAAELIDQARATLRQRMPEALDHDDTDHPAPPRGADQ